MGFIGKHLKPTVSIGFGSQDCLFKTSCTTEGSNTTFFNPPSNTKCSFWSLSRPLQKQTTSSVNSVLSSKHLALCSYSIRASQAHTTPSLMGRRNNSGQSQPAADAVGSLQPACWSGHCYLPLWSPCTLTVCMGAQSWLAGRKWILLQIAIMLHCIWF